MTTPTDRAFAVFPRGYTRDDILAQFRVGLRLQRNPETGNLFTEDEISRATQRGSRWWIQADADDLVLLSSQARGVWLSQQMRPDRASSAMLYGFHGALWGQDRLPAAGGFGTVLAKATAGTVFAGSTTVPSAGALTARDVATGLRFQVQSTATVPSGQSSVLVTLVGIDTGPSTNLDPDAQVKWESPPLGAEPQALVTSKFSGGRGQETDSEFADRLGDAMRHKQAAGNRAHFRAWARSVSTSILDAYVYSCALHAGSVVVCVTQGRNGAVGPTALQAAAPLLLSCTSYLVPPASPVVPERVFVLVTTFQSQPSDLTLRVSLPKNNAGGWHDPNPWPGFTSAVTTVQSVTSSTQFSVRSDVALPTGITAPALMWWNKTRSSFVALNVGSVASLGADVYSVSLNSPVPTAESIQAGDVISPYVNTSISLGEAIEGYFDSLGPGEVVDLDADTRSDRAWRFPDQAEESSSSAGLGVVAYLIDGLGSSLSTAVPSFSVSSPSIPTRPQDGPFKLTLGNVGVYPV